VFFNGTRIIATVVSYGMNPQCKGLDFSYRLDQAEVLAWILDPNGSTPAEPPPARRAAALPPAVIARRE